MRSLIAEKLGLEHEPVALLWSDERPAGAVQFKPGRWGCVMFLAAGAARGRTAVVDHETWGCWGGGVGLGFGNCYRQFPGGEGAFARFLSDGNDACAEGRAVAEALAPHVRPEFLDDFVRGERYMASPEVVHRFVDALPITEVPAAYVVLKPLSAVAEDERPVSVTFFADPDQVSALVVLANFDAGEGDRVIAPYAAACQQLGILAYREAEARRPRAVLGLTDLSARENVRRQLGRAVLSFTVPLALLETMESHVDESFLERGTWQRLRAD